MKKIKVEICHFKDSLEDRDIVNQGYFDYDSNTTFADLFNAFNISDVLTDDKESIIHMNEIEEENLYLKFIFKNGKILWHFPLPQCLIKDYLDTYSLNKIVLFEPKSIGGISFPEVDWEVLFELIKNGYFILEHSLVLYEGYKVINELYKRFILNRKNVVPIQTIQKAIKMKNIWSLDEFRYQFDLESEDSARVLLLYAGYIYNEESNLYFYNDVQAKKHQQKFNELANELLADKNIENICNSIRNSNWYK